MKKLALLVVLTFCTYYGFAQPQVVQHIKKSMHIDESAFKAASKSFSFYIALCVNENGELDSIYCPKNKIVENKIIDIKDFSNKLKSDKTVFGGYKKHVLITQIYVQPQGGKEVDALGNFMDGSKEIMDFVLEERKTKRVSFIDAVLIVI